MSARGASSERARLVAASVVLGVSVGCGGSWEVDPKDEAPGDDDEPIVPAPAGLHVVGNHIEDEAGNRVMLRGVNRSGSEYQCVKNRGFFDGPEDRASILAMKRWKINAVRVPLNESCWLGKDAVAPLYRGGAYKQAIQEYVRLLVENGMTPILDLHWSAPGDTPPLELWPLPNADNTPEFWGDVAATFADDDHVILEPYNEPFPDSNQDSERAWECWRDGCEVTFRDQTYQAAGMQLLVDAIRRAGSRHVVLLGGVQYSNALSGWLEHKPSDPLDNLGVAWHVYNYNRCNDDVCWDGVPAALSAEFPVVATEIGQDDCEGQTFLEPLMQFLDERSAGYLAWAWNAHGDCVPSYRSGQPWSLITNYAEPEPNSNYARTFYEHLQGVQH